MARVTRATATNFKSRGNQHMKTLLRKRLQTERGVATLEYALLGALIAVVAIAGIGYAGQAANCTFMMAGGSIRTSIGTSTQFGPNGCVVNGFAGAETTNTGW